MSNNPSDSDHPNTTPSDTTTARTVVNVSQTIGGAALKVPQGLSAALDWIKRSPVLRALTQNFQVDWLARAIDAVDIAKVAAKVKELQQRYPDEKSDRIAHRLITEKALLVAGTGLAGSLIPGVAISMVGVDLATTTAWSAELVYEIAAAYGMDLKAIERKAEVLAIFGLSVGGNAAIEAGLSFAGRLTLDAGISATVGNVPLLGAALNASTNAAMIYALGYGASRFYRARLSSASSDEVLKVVQAESEDYLEEAIAQQIIVDWILAYAILAGNPEKTWEQLLQELKATPDLNLSPASVAAIEANWQSPPSLDSLFDRLNSDFAVSLMAQCQKIAQLDSAIAPAEAQLLAKIEEKAKLKIQKADDIKSDREKSDSTTTQPTPPNLPQTPPKKVGSALLESLKEILNPSVSIETDEIDYLVKRIDRMKREDFEEFIALCFEKLGYQVDRTPQAGDFGADLLLTQAETKTIVQAKRSRKEVDIAAVQAAIGAIKYYQAQAAIVMTNRQFTPSARELGGANGVELWERGELIDLILRAKQRSV
jgi:uncharacterized protein (DUF697 family)